MKRNTKGFTLVELLAALVILGVLMIFSVPIILGMLDSSRNKIYIDDAKKMIAQVEYRIRSSNSTIAKPSEGSAIVISLAYLESTDFDNPPNNGEYLKEASYVVVKNTGKRLEYSASIVEKMKKGGYKGVVLTSNSDLLKRHAEKNVKAFDKNSLYYVDTAPTGNVLSTEDINNFLGSNYCEEIEAVYNDLELSNDVVRDEDTPPKIKSLTIASASNKDFNTFDAVLTLKAEDDNTLKKDLKIYISTVSYDDAMRSTAELYGSSKDYYIKRINFSDAKYGGYKKYDGSKITVYVVVKDDTGNISKKIQEYYLHNNAAPIIDLNENATSIEARNSDSHAMPKATLKLVVSDDSDAREDLLICLKPSKGVCSAGEFRKYREYFGTGTTMTYDFGGIPDGRSMTLHIEAKDSDNLVTSTDLSYQIYNNEPPQIEKVTVNSSNNDLPDSVRDGKGDLTINFRVQASDDFGVSNIILSVQDMTTPKAAAEFKYTDCSKAVGCSYKLGGKYDGKIRNIKFTFRDQYNASSFVTKDYEVYANKPPVVTASLSTKGNACTNTSFCKGSNSVSTNFKLSASDDIDYINNYANLKVCVSQDQADCNNPSSSNYKSYSQYAGKTSNLLLSSAAYPYDGSTKRVYVSVVDTYGAVTKKTLEYKIYKNQAPTGLSASVETVEDTTFPYSSFKDSDYSDFNLKNAIVHFQAKDDFGTGNLDVNICYEKTFNGTSTVSSTPTCTGYKTYSSFTGSQLKITLPETKYLGQKYLIRVKVKDKYGQEITTSKEYVLFKDLAPKIDNFVFSSKNDYYNTSTINYSYKIRDAFDKYSVCIGGRDSSDTPTTYEDCVRNHYYLKENVNGNGINSISGTIDLTKFGLNYDNGTKKYIYLYVKDSNAHTKSVGKYYTLYHYCTELSSGYDTSYVLVAGQQAITAERCGGRCYQAVGSSEAENINLGVKASYNQVLTYKDKHFSGKSCPKEEKIETTCDFFTCYQKEDSYYKAVGVNPFEEEWSHTHADGQTYAHDFYYKMYTLTYDAVEDLLKFSEMPTKICPDDIDNFTMQDGYVYTNDSGGESIDEDTESES